MNRISVLMAGILICSPVVASENDYRCLKSIGLKNPVRLQFVFPADNERVGYVTYQNGDGRIAVRRAKEKEIRRVPGGRPSVFETQWEETTPAGAGGTYIMVSQGALITEFRYIRKKDGKTFEFEEDLEAPGESQCEWNSR